MRAFIAIELPEQTKEYLKRVQEKLKSAQADVKWVGPQNIHLTLKFLGEIDEKTKDKIIETLQDLSRTRSSFSINISTLGAFPGIESPRVIWVGIDQGDSQVKELAKDIEDRLATLGIPRQVRPFSSHITLARIRSSKNLKNLTKELTDLQSKLSSPIPEFTADKIVLFKSTLTPQGPVYEVIKEVRLG